MADSPFLAVPPSEWIDSNAKAFAIWDSFPVSPGHVLVITKRLVATWFDADRHEQAALLELVNVVKRHLDATLEPKPDGYNVGFNAGESAGQTVMHLHVHVIPRYSGDVKDPRGGVRYVIPDKANYLLEPKRTKGELRPQSGSDLQLSTGHPDSPLWEQLSWRIAGARTVDILASFVQLSGLDVIESRLFDALQNDAQIRILISDYLHISAPQALDRLLGWCDSALEEATSGQLSARLIEIARLPSGPASFHPKSWYIADRQSVICASQAAPPDGYGTAMQLAVSSKDLLSSTKQRLRDYDYALPIADDQSRNGFKVGNLRLTTIEQLCKTSVGVLDGVILFDPACHVHKAKIFTRFDGTNHDRPQLIADYLSSRRSNGAASLFCLMTRKAPRVVGTARIAEAYMQDGWWFVDPYSLRFTDA